MIASISFSENNPVASSSSFLALSVIESAPALTAPAAAETLLVTPLTSFFSPLFRRPSLRFLGAAEELEELEEPPEDPLEDPLEDPDPPEPCVTLADPDPPLLDEDDELEEPPEPCLPLS